MADLPENQTPSPAQNPNPAPPPQPSSVPLAPGASSSNPPRVNPNLETVQLNQKKPLANTNPVASVPTVPATGNAAIGVKDPLKKGKDLAADKKRFLMGCFGGFLVLFILFILLMVFVLSQAGADNPVLRAFNLNPANLRQFLLGVVGLSFGAVSLLLLVLSAVGIFRFMGAKKEDKFQRQSGIKLTFFSFIPLLIVLALWLFLFNFINTLSLQAEAIPAVITVVEPTDLKNLSAPVEITFSALNVGQNLQASGLKIEKMEWDLDGDGSYETPIFSDPQVVQLYTRRGFYNVSLRAFIAGEKEPRVYQLPLNIEQATFRANPEVGSVPLTVRFDATDLIPANTRIQRFDWDFNGDGVYEIEKSDAQQVEHIFRQIGQYEVHLRMLNAQNNVENYYKTIQVTNSQIPPIEAKAELSPGLEGTLPFQVQFNGEPSSSLQGSITSYVWNFGDGSAEARGKSVNHVYQQAGKFSAQLTVQDDLGNRAQTTMDVVVKANLFAPVAIISTTPTFDQRLNELKGEATFKVVFDASGSTDRDGDIVEYMWDFNGDGQVDGRGERVEHTFSEAGEFKVGLKVEDAQGQSDQSSLIVQVAQPPLLARIQADSQEGVPPLVVSFDGSGSRASEGRIVSYEWNFGDGSPSTLTGALITRQYTRVGNYTASLKVTTDTGEVAQTTLPIFVREIPLEACFTSSRKQGLAPLGVSFDVKCSTGTIAQYNWDFGDGNKGNSYNPSHTFQSPGEYTVTLTVSDNKNNLSIDTEVITVEAPPPPALR